MFKLFTSEFIRTNSIPPASHVHTVTTSDEQVDRIAEGHLQAKQNQHNVKTRSDLCILPIPVLLPIVLPLTSDFIYKNFKSYSH